MAAPLPAAVREALHDAYTVLSRAHGETATDVAVRSSATAEDLPTASFAGQQETYLNVRGAAALNAAVRACLASLFTDRAIVYRAQHGFAHRDVALSVGVQKMVRSDLGSAGVIFTLDPETGFRDVVLVTGSWGLGEAADRDGGRRGTSPRTPRRHRRPGTERLPGLRRVPGRHRHRLDLTQPRRAPHRRRTPGVVKNLTLPGLTLPTL